MHTTKYETCAVCANSTNGVCIYRSTELAGIDLADTCTTFTQDAGLKFAEDLVAGDTIVEADGYLLDVVDALVDGNRVKLVITSMMNVMHVNMPVGTLVNVWHC